ncbi:TPA: hypothetical protein UM684_004569 [Stenotrophomonas maltophilia]|uniref:hypothetical protein n=1 Tax=Stenotrophomonas maltophilia TaxID=40324 RepID=UPI0014628941|nr:hypothetical protein [Stenotrophomonas maltophilia]MBH1380599.1 hypothetical protein [Stenotrophomonas maltophilia]MBH1396861.1 hypothetical protein [Stenotrophomonas maltophilia]MBH1468408.1 hypothetical protein [Stenotrophomonas maltophilia]MBH1472925.1 hypothetical protein [Stenotrophomonas maltophilia]QJP19308.1 hypothetical protein HKK60_07070 [Stenotrophomonas maltophilia]
MTLTAAAKKIRAKRARRPIYLVVAKLIDPNTGELVGALVQANAVDQRLLRDRKFRVGREIRGELKQPREEWQHRLIQKIGHLMVDNVEGWEQLDANVCCEMVELDATPVISAVLDACEAMLGAGARKVIAGVLPAIRTVPVKRAESLSFDEMEQARFQELFDGLTEYIGHRYTYVMLDDVRAEFWNMAGSNRRVA